MDTKPLCPSCGKPLEANAPKGLCPECLMKGAFPTGTDTGGKSPRFVPPRLADLAAKFPQLEILEFIGQGGMGAVYKTRQKQLNRLVALKILPPGVGGDRAFAERFTREARALAQLNHPGIVTLYEFGQTDGLFYFLMEFVDGVNLRQLLHASRLAPKEALAIVPQICEALQYAHERGIVHRDIKPENILMNKEGQVKIADFGVAKIVAQELVEMAVATNPPAQAGELTKAGSTLGTPQYMAPEQIKNSAEVDHRADIYSLGVVFYQMLTGELPSGKIEPPSKKVQIDVRLDEVVLRALEREPDRRYQHASEVKTHVERIATTDGPKLEPSSHKVEGELPSAGYAVRTEPINPKAKFRDRRLAFIKIPFVTLRAGNPTTNWPAVILTGSLIVLLEAAGMMAAKLIGIRDAFVPRTLCLVVLPAVLLIPLWLAFEVRAAHRALAAGKQLLPLFSKRKSRLHRLVGVLLAAFVIAFFIRTFLVAPYRVPTNAAAPEIPRGSHFLVWRPVWTFAPDDIVAFWHHGAAWVGRVINSADGVITVGRNGQAAMRVKRADILGKVITIYWRGSKVEGSTQKRVTITPSKPKQKTIGLLRSTRIFSYKNQAIALTTSEIGFPLHEIVARFSGPPLTQEEELRASAIFGYGPTLVPSPYEAMGGEWRPKPLQSTAATRGDEPSACWYAGPNECDFQFALPDESKAKAAAKQMQAVLAKPLPLHFDEHIPLFQVGQYKAWLEVRRVHPPVRRLAFINTDLRYAGDSLVAGRSPVRPVGTNPVYSAAVAIPPYATLSLTGTVYWKPNNETNGVNAGALSLMTNFFSTSLTNTLDQPGLYWLTWRPGALNCTNGFEMFIHDGRTALELRHYVFCQPMKYRWRADWSYRSSTVEPGQPMQECLLIDDGLTHVVRNQPRPYGLFDIAMKVQPLSRPQPPNASNFSANSGKRPSTTAWPAPLSQSLQFRLVLPKDSTSPAEWLSSASGSTRFHVSRQVLLDGSAAAQAGVSFSPVGKRMIEIRFTDAGTKEFKDITATNIGRQLAIVFDGHVLSAPIIQSAIPGGECQIDGPRNGDQIYDQIVNSLNRTASPASWQFSRVRERILPFQSNPKALFGWLDLNSGIVLTNSTLDWTTRSGHEWIQRHDLDVVTTESAKHFPVLLGVDMIVAPAPTNGWEIVNPTDVADNWALSQDEPRQDQVFGAMPGKSDTYFFQNREGKRGLLQILGFARNPHGVKVRYKLVQSQK